MPVMGKGERMYKKPFLLAGLVLILSACTMPDDEFDYIETEVITTASPSNVKVGDAVEVTLVGSFELDERSRVPERPISDIIIGTCFTHGKNADNESIGESHGFCGNEAEVLPSSYRLLSGTEYTKRFDGAVVKRGERLEFEHTFMFTSTEADKLFLDAQAIFMDEAFTGPSYSGNPYSNSPEVTFE